MGDRGENIITAKDDMDFFRTILKFMKRMSPIDNFEFRQGLMIVIKKYVLKNYRNATVNTDSQVKEEVGGLYEESKGNVLQEPNQHVGRRESLSGRGVLVEQPPQLRQEEQLKVTSTKQEIVQKENVKMEYNPLAAAFAHGYHSVDRKPSYEQEDSDSEVEEVEIKIVNPRKRPRF